MSWTREKYRRQSYTKKKRMRENMCGDRKNGDAEGEKKKREATEKDLNLRCGEGLTRNRRKKLQGNG